MSTPAGTSETNGSRLFVVAGRKGAGKDTFYLRAREKNPGLRVVRFAFIDPLKHFCEEILGISRAALGGTQSDRNLPTEYDWPEDNPYGKRGRMTAREVLQYVGTDLLRKRFDPDLWVKSTLRKIRETEFDIGVIADARFPGEVEAARSVGATAVRLLRTPYPEDRHPTELALDGYPDDRFDHVVPDMPLPSYLAEVDRILTNISGTTE